MEERVMDNTIYIVGANPRNPSSIGSEIAAKFEDNGWNVERESRSSGFSHSVTTTRMMPFHPETRALVISIGGSKIEPVGKMDYNSIFEQVDSNLTEVIALVNKFVRETEDLSHRRRKIVIVGSMAHRKVLTNMSVYSAAKAGVGMFVKSAAFELATKGIDIYVVHPSSVIHTPMSGKMIQDNIVKAGITREEATKKMEGSWIREPIRVSDIAEPVFQLIDNPFFSQASGTSIEIAGGQR